MPEENKILVMGLGNVLLNDEGIGVHAVREFEKMKLPENVETLDGGTGGFVLLSLFQEYKTIIIIDAALIGDKEGEIKVLKPRYATDFPPSMSTHELGMKDMIESAMLLEKVPELFLIAVNINPQQDMDMVVSDKMKARVPQIIEEIKKILKLKGINF